MKTYTSLLVDDIRDYDNITKVCRNFQDACVEVNENKYDFLYLDHDLGEVSTGYDFINYCINRDIKFGWIVIVSSNPVGRDNIGFVLRAAGYIQKNLYIFQGNDNI